TVIDFEYLDFALCPLTVMAAQTATPTCFIPNSGEITLSVSGGDGPYSWTWNRSNPVGSDSGVGTIINSLAAGSYEITVTSDGGCTGTTTQVIEEPIGPELDTIVVNASCLGNDGTIDLLVFGGSGDYAYFWNDGGVSEDRAGLTSGNYSVTVWDNLNGCFSVT